METDNMANMILSNTSIQEELALLMEANTRTERQKYETSIYGVLCSYLFNVSNLNISYISILQDNSEITTFSPLSQKLPSDIKKELIKTAKSGEGATIWVTDYSQEYGLFLVKELRESKYLSLNSLGTLIININTDFLVSQATAATSDYETMSFFLASGDTLIYPSEDISQEKFLDLKNRLKQKYEIIHVDGESFFAVRGQIPHFKWDYFCIVSYESIAHTISVTLRLCTLAMIISICIVFFTSSSILSSLTKHFDWLIYKMNRFGEGNYTLPEDACDYGERKDEIGQLHINFNSMANKVDALIKENYVNELLKKEAQLKALESQMDPHFLYNTLDSINWRAKSIKADDISQITTALGNLLRISLSKTNYPFNVQQEMHILENYITIQKLRYPRRLEYSSDIPEKFWNCEIPKFTIQPLLENAIRYGLEEISEICYISVTAFSSDKNLIIEVKNNGSQFEENLLEKLESNELQPHGFGIGILNIHKRLRITYGPDYGLYLYNMEDEDDGEEYAVARITLPLIPLTKGDS
ncbi:MAG: sensor histidine kinase [Oliverpabstia sp.]